MRGTYAHLSTYLGRNLVIRGQIEKAVVLQVKDTKTTYRPGIQTLGIGSDTKNVKKLKFWGGKSENFTLMAKWIFPLIHTLSMTYSLQCVRNTTLAVTSALFVFS